MKHTIYRKLKVKHKFIKHNHKNYLHYGGGISKTACMRKSIQLPTFIRTYVCI